MAYYYYGWCTNGESVTLSTHWVGNIAVVGGGSVDDITVEVNAMLICGGS